MPEELIAPIANNDSNNRPDQNQRRLNLETSELTTADETTQQTPRSPAEEARWRIDYWMQKAEEQHNQLQEDERVIKIQAEIEDKEWKKNHDFLFETDDSANPELDSPAITNYKKIVNDEPSGIENTRRWLNRGAMSVFDRIQNPDKVQTTVRYLEATVQDEDSQYIYRKKNESIDSLRKRIKVFLAKGYKIGDRTDLDDDDIHSIRLDKAKKLHLNRNSRQNIDRLSSVIEDPAFTLHALRAIGLNVTPRLFQIGKSYEEHGTMQNLEKMCKAVNGMQDVLIDLGQGISWEQFPAYNDDVVEIFGKKEIFAKLSDQKIRRSLKEFINKMADKPHFRDIEALIGIVIDDNYIATLQLLSESTKYNMAKSASIRAIHRMGQVGDLTIMARMQRAGIKLDRHDRGDIVEITEYTNNNEPVELERANEVLKRTKARIGESLADDNVIFFLQKLRSIVPIKIYPGELDSIAKLYEHEKEVIAFISFLVSINADMAKKVTLRDIENAVTNPENLAKVLNPKYAKFLKILIKSDLRLNLGYDPISEMTSFSSGQINWVYSLFQNEEIREAFFDEPLHEFLNYLNENGIIVRIDRWSSHVNFLIKVGKIAGVPKILSALKAHGIEHEDLDGMFYNRNEIFNLCNAESIAALNDPRFEAIKTRLAELQLQPSSTEDIPNNKIFEQIRNAITALKSPELTEALLDDNKYEKIKAFIARLAEHGKKLVADSPDEIAKLTDSHVQKLDEFIEFATSSTTVNISDYLIFCNQTAIVKRGLSRYQELHQTTEIPADIRSLAKIGESESWQVNELKKLIGEQERTIEEIQAVMQDFAGFKEFAEYYASITGYNIIDATRNKILKLSEFVPFRKQITEIQNDFKLATGKELVSRDILETSIDSLQIFCNINSATRQELFKHFNNRSKSFDEVISSALNFYNEINELPNIIIDAINERFGDDWDAPLDLSSLKSLTEDDYIAILDAFVIFSEKYEVSFQHLPEFIKLYRGGVLDIIDNAKTSYGYIPNMNRHWDDLCRFAEQNKDNQAWNAFVDVHERFGISFIAALENPEAVIILSQSTNIPIAIEQLKTAGIQMDEFGDLLNAVSYWEQAGQNPASFNLMLRLKDYFVTLNIYDIRYFSPFKEIENVADVESYVAEITNSNNGKLNPSQIGKIIDTLQHRETVITLLTQYNIDFSDIILGSELKFTEELLKAGIIEEVTKNKKFKYEFNINHAYRLKVLTDDQQKWNTIIKLNEKYGIILEDFIINDEVLNMYLLIEPELRYAETEPLNIRDQQILAAGLMSRMIHDERFEPLDDLKITVTTEHGTEVPASAYAKEFLEAYQIGNKGRTILTLLMAREFIVDMPIENVFTNVFEALVNYRKILDSYNDNQIPNGLRASIGMEHEITNSTDVSYRDTVNARGLKFDMQTISKYAGISQGNDAVHEIATRPTNNPYALLLEMKLLQDLEFFDLNFSRHGYEKGAHGYHLTIGGERGIKATPNVHFLQNLLIISGWGGVNAGDSVSYVSRGRTSSAIRERNLYGSNNIQVFANATASTELRSLSIDQWEPFERSIITSHYAAVAIQAMEEFTKITPEDIYKFDNLPATPADLREALAMNDLLPTDTPPPLDKVSFEIIHAWLQLNVEIQKIIKDHNENFLNNESYGYENERGVWVEIEEFGGEQNRNRFTAVVSSIDESRSLEDYTSKLTIDPESLYDGTEPEFVNTLIKVNNLFLKPSTKSSSGETVDSPRENALAMLDTTKRNGNRIEDAKSGAASQSIFDNNGMTRRGYYNAQGGSERMITHAVQIALLKFNAKMEKLVRKPTPIEEPKTMAA
ncbi:MAG: hypothetical protein Q8P90_03835 [bacterium]|nr:hypothetical protein [bacterium]